jgi:hypothetical protein
MVSRGTSALKLQPGSGIWSVKLGLRQLGLKNNLDKCIPSIYFVFQSTFYDLA